MREKTVEIRVIYADTDAMGVVYHMNYIRWFEIGRTELIRDMGVVYADMERQGYHLPVTELHCHYQWPARYDQIVCVKTKIAYMRRASIKFEYEIYEKSENRLLVEGYSVHAFIDDKGKIVRPPREVADRISQGMQEK